MRRTTRRGLTALIATAGIVAGVLPSVGSVAQAAGETPITVSQMTQTAAANTNTNVPLVVSHSTHYEDPTMTQDVIMFLQGPPVQPGSATRQTVYASGVTVDGTFLDGEATVSGNFNLAPSGSPVGPGNWDLNICYSTDNLTCSDDGVTSTEEKGVGVFQVLGSTPSITAIAPTSRAAGSSQLFTVTGTELSRGGTLSVEFDGTPQVGFVFSNYTYSGNATTTANLAVSSVPARVYDVRVTNTDGKTFVLTDSLTVTPAVSLASNNFISPAGVTKGVINYPFTIKGAEFQPGVTVTAVDPAQTGAAQTAGVTFVVDTVKPDGTQIDGRVTVSPTATPTSTTATVSRNLVVTNPDNGSASVVGGFQLYPVPTISTVSPTPRGRGWTGDLTVTGTNFRQVGADNTPPSFNLGNGVTYGSVVYSSSTSLTVKDVVIDQSATLGGRTITVKNADGGDVTSPANAWTIEAAPIVGTVSPSRAPRGSNPSITIQGTGFTTTANKMQLQIFEPLSKSVICTSPDATASSTTSLTTTCAIPQGTPIGEYAIRLTNLANGGTSVCANTCFSIDAFGVTGISPSNLLNSETQPVQVIVTGSALPSDATISLRHNPSLFDQAELVPVACPQNQTCGTSVDKSSVTQWFSFNGVAPGKYDVLVSGTPSDSNQQTLSQCGCQLTVTTAGSPTITNVSQTEFVQGTTAKTVTVTGNYFYPGSRAIISGGDGKAVVVSGSELVASDHKSMTFKITVDPAAATPGSNSLKIIDSSSPTPFSSSSVGLTITKAPLIKTVAPTSIGRGAVTAADGFTVTGTDFKTATQFTACTGVTVDPNSVVVTDNTPPTDDVAKMKLTVASDAPLGPCAITATNPDTGTNTAATMLTITAAPVATDVSPQAVGKGVTRDLTVTGTGFASGVTVAFLRNAATDPDITVNSVTVDNANQLTVNITTSATAVLGKRDVRFTNTDLGTSTCADCLAVATVPGVVSNVVATPGDGKARVTWTAPTDDGGDPVAAYTITVSPGNRVVPSPGTGTSAVIGGLTNGTAYTFTVSAKNNIGNGTPVGTSSAVTPAVNARLVAIKPSTVVRSSSGLGIPGGVKGRVTNKTFDFQLSGAPANAIGATFVATVNFATTATTVRLYGTGTTVTPAFVNAFSGINKSGTSFVRFGSTVGKVRVAVTGSGYLTIDQTGWLIRGDKDGSAAATAGGVFVSVPHKTIISAGTDPTKVPPSNSTYYKPLTGLVPSNSEAVLLQVTATNTRSDGRILAYSTADGPTTGMTFMNGRRTSQLLVARVSSVAGKCTTSDQEAAAASNRLCVRVTGLSGVKVALVGYWSKSTSAFPGRVVSITPTRILSATTARPAGSVTSSVKVPSSVPSSATAVLLQVTTFGTSGASVVKVYFNGAIPPEETTYTSKGDTASNIGLATITAANRFVKMYVYGASTKMYVDVIGYIN